MEHNCVLLDTSFFIRLLNENDPLHRSALDYYRHFLLSNFVLRISTISIAEYCVRGEMDELPLRDLQIVPFNITHAARAGKLAAVIFEHRSQLQLPDRKIISNDTKLFAQADTETSIHKFATSDEESIKMFNLIKQYMPLRFDIINIRKPYNETFGFLPLDL